MKGSRTRQSVTGPTDGIYQKREVMDILVASSEVVPFAKTGGLADVCGALPRELSRLGHRVTVFFLPIVKPGRQVSRLRKPDIQLEIPIGAKMVDGNLLRTQLPDSEVIVYLVNQPDYFDRDQLYGKGVETSPIIVKDSCFSAVLSGIGSSARTAS